MKQYQIEDEDELLEDFDNEESVENTCRRALGYVCLPLLFLREPPLRHRGDPTCKLTVFECVVLGACLMLARQRAFAQARHEVALIRGDRKVRRFRRKVAARSGNISYHGKSRAGYSRKVQAQFSKEGQEGYKEGKRQFIATEALPLTVTRAALLRAMGAAPYKADNLKKLKDALARLKKPIIKGLPPLLHAVQKLPNGKLRLIINPQWFPGPGKFGQLYWPPPKCGGGATTVLALYLFLGSCNFVGYRDIPLEGLYRRLGIREQRASHARRALDKALKAVNANLLPRNWLKAQWHETAGFPQSFAMRIREDRVRFSRPDYKEETHAVQA